MTAEGLPEIARIAAPSPEEFSRRYVATSTPVVLTDAIVDWPARSRWTPRALAERFRGRRVPAAVSYGGTLKHDGRAGIPYREVDLGAFLGALEDDPAPSELVTFALEEHAPELAADVRPYPYERGARWSRRRVWFAAGGVASPLHQDLPENLYAQVYGRKRFHLYAPSDSHRMYRFPWLSSLPNFGRVDVEAPDLARFPAFAGARGTSVVLEPGDVLFLPSRWWHQTRSLGPCLSTNLWWSSARPLATVLRAAEWYKRVRGLSM